MFVAVAGNSPAARHTFCYISKRNITVFTRNYVFPVHLIELLGKSNTKAPRIVSNTNKSMICEGCPANKGIEICPMLFEKYGFISAWVQEWTLFTKQNCVHSRKIQHKKKKITHKHAEKTGKMNWFTLRNAIYAPHICRIRGVLPDERSP